MKGTNRFYVKKAFEQLKRENNCPGLRLGRHISDGSFASVYRVNGSVNRELVVKAIDTSIISENISAINPEEKYAYAKQEINAMKLCKGYDNIMPLIYSTEFVVDASAHHSVFLLVMPKLVTLCNYIKRMTIEDVIDMIKAICKALTVCHSKEILHRDISIKNIFVDIDKKGEKKYILGDFGASRMGLKNRDMRGCFCDVTCIGTYRAPELFCKDFILSSYNSDLYSLGYMVDLFIARRLINNRPDIERIIKKACAEDPINVRYQTAEEMLEDLERIDSGQLDSERPSLSVACKNAIIKGDYAKALKLANEGCENDDISCKRLRTYLLYKLYRKPEEGCAEISREQAVEALHNLAKVVVHTEDVTSNGLYVLLQFNLAPKGSKERYEWFEKLKLVAEEGCAFAQYYCGRWLIDGNVSDVERNVALGSSYLNDSIKQRYIAAYVYFKKLERRHPDFCWKYDKPEIIRLPENINDELNKKISANSLVEAL